VTDAKSISLHGAKQTDEQDRIRKQLRERLDEIFLKLRDLGVGFLRRGTSPAIAG